MLICLYIYLYLCLYARIFIFSAYTCNPAYQLSVSTEPGNLKPIFVYVALEASIPKP